MAAAPANTISVSGKEASVVLADPGVRQVKITIPDQHKPSSRSYRKMLWDHSGKIAFATSVALIASQHEPTVETVKKIAEFVANNYQPVVSTFGRVAQAMWGFFSGFLPDIGLINAGVTGFWAGKKVIEETKKKEFLRASAAAGLGCVFVALPYVLRGPSVPLAEQVAAMSKKTSAIHDILKNAVSELSKV